MRKKNTIYFNVPFISGDEIKYIKDAIKKNHFKEIVNLQKNVIFKFKIILNVKILSLPIHVLML